MCLFHIWFFSYSITHSKGDFDIWAFSILFSFKGELDLQDVSAGHLRRVSRPSLLFNMRQMFCSCWLSSTYCVSNIILVFGSEKFQSLQGPSLSFHLKHSSGDLAVMTVQKRAGVSCHQSFIFGIDLGRKFSEKAVSFLGQQESL